MIPRITLKTGASMPTLGLGTWKMSSGEAAIAVGKAIQIGYRLIDTATLYGNEAGVGRAIRDSSVPREELFVTTKLWPTDFFDVRAAFERSMERLGLEYVDLYLVHWPIPMMPKSVWQEVERIADSGRARAIGVSNYDVEDLASLLSYARITPAVNQIKCNIFDFTPDVLDYCAKHGIVVEAYSPLARGSRIDDARVTTIAQKYEKTPAQIMLRWCIEHGTIPIPKSSSETRMRENLGVFDFTISAEDMQTLDRLG